MFIYCCHDDGATRCCRPPHGLRLAAATPAYMAIWRAEKIQYNTALRRAHMRERCYSNNKKNGTLPRGSRRRAKGHYEGNVNIVAMAVGGVAASYSGRRVPRNVCVTYVHTRIVRHAARSTARWPYGGYAERQRNASTRTRRAGAAVSGGAKCRQASRGSRSSARSWYRRRH